jgi:DNA helicase-2/ATP-dependent DNA helicase PcrA
MLCKQVANGKANWNIHLQSGNTPGQLIGRTTNQLSLDLLHMLHDRGYPLPSRIFNLRVSVVGTVTSDNLSNLGEPERTSGLWLGVGLFGTGDFRTIRSTGQ